MRLLLALTTSLLIPALLLAQAPAGRDAPVTESKGMPARATPGDYQAQAKAGAITVAAEFVGHAVPTPEQTLSTEDYVVVEVALFGPPDARTTLARGNFSLRIAGKKAPLSSEPYELVFQSLKDPEWSPPGAPESKSKGGLTTGGGGGQGGQDNLPPAPVHMPFELRRAMEQHVQKAALLEGDRALPQAGLLFFRYHGKVEGIRSLDLVYSGPAGTATIALQP
jgi:hypothetical protein